MIEGTQSSLSDLLLFELDQEPGVPLDDVREVSNYVAALDHGLRRLEEGLPLSLRLFREIHGVLLTKGRGSKQTPGEFRRSQNWIGGTRPGNAAFRSSSGRRGAGLHEQTRTVPARPARADPGAAQGGAGPCAVRDDPPVPRRQRPLGPPADHAALMRTEGAAGADALPQPLLQDAPPVLLRTAQQRAPDR